MTAGQTESVEAMISRGFARGPDGDGMLAANGEPFVTFKVGCTIKPNAVDEHDDLLAMILRTCIHRHFAPWGEFPAIYWRRTPEFDAVPQSESQWRMLRCRVLISSIPVAAP